MLVVLVLLFWFSNMARRFLTPPLGLASAMVERNVSAAATQQGTEKSVDVAISC